MNNSKSVTKYDSQLKATTNASTNAMIKQWKSEGPAVIGEEERSGPAGED